MLVHQQDVFRYLGDVCAEAASWGLKRYVWLLFQITIAELILTCFASAVSKIVRTLK